ncbi:hypothetical protein TSOC_002672 [Tetrabaena socialis]|uniref:Uncharacterized protein n=1 Tax=Tetrabaena socialis TaxID=47790 RepID=A0A2J8ADH6_9CHLO|nr:hypothetical protein TSOC_002672 [Tetrabaena socialis]|eukprot:PNH10559.1 hypothetical protein TSOC_002672 [Tetrabaena socialis]
MLQGAHPARARELPKASAASATPAWAIRELPQLSVAGRVAAGEWGSRAARQHAAPAAVHAGGPLPYAASQRAQARCKRASPTSKGLPSRRSTMTSPSTPALSAMRRQGARSDFITMSAPSRSSGASAIISPMKSSLPAEMPARWYEGAAERGHIRVLALALEAGEPPANAARALHLAAEHGRAGTLRLLLERGAAERINIQELVAAAAKGKGDSEGTVLAILEEGGAWLPLPFAGRADLAHTVLGGLWRRKPPQHRRVVDWCLGQPDGPTCCLLWAAEEGDYEMVCAALAAGADTSALGGAALQRRRYGLQFQHE